MLSATALFLALMTPVPPAGARVVATAQVRIVRGATIDFDAQAHLPVMIRHVDKPVAPKRRLVEFE